MSLECRECNRASSQRKDPVSPDAKEYLCCYCLMGIKIRRTPWGAVFVPPAPPATPAVGRGPR